MTASNHAARAAILRKIKACLRLAASSNAHEAAAALRQAQAMMAKHGVEAAEVSGVGEAEALTRARGAEPSRSICSLAQLCARGFGARIVIEANYGRTVMRFYGMDGAAEISAYAFTVLRHQLDRDRLKHIARVRKRGNREARGETFANAWVCAVAGLFPGVEVEETKRLAIAELIRLRHPHTETTSGRDLTKHGKASDSDAWAGHRAGKQAHLHRGVHGHASPALEHAP